MDAGSRPVRGLAAVEAVSFDFGNTLVPMRREDLGRVVAQMTAEVARRCGPFDEAAFGAAWAVERERQFAEDVPRMREVDLAERVRRVLAQLRGLAPPDPLTPWDDDAAAAYSTPDEIELAIEAYATAFVDRIAVPPEVGPLLARLAARRRLAICSNWPLAISIDQFVEAAGWAASLRAVVVSQRVGAIKPDRRIFAAAEAALGTPPGSILHVGDDWAADVVGAKRAGWRAAYLTDRPVDSPLPGSEPDAAVEPDLRIARLADLEAALGG